MDHLTQIVEKLQDSKNVLIFPHINMDGDAMGSAVALCKGLRSLNRQSYILLEDDIPPYLAFLEKDYCVQKAPISPDVCIAVDCGDVSRIEKRKEEFFSAATTICIDHHLIRGPFTDLSMIDQTSSATGMLIFTLLKALNVSIDREMADALFVAIITDTGSFRYSNADRTTHLAVAELYDYGLNHVPLCNLLYDSVPPSQLRIETDILRKMELFASGKACISYSTSEMLEAAGATADQTEAVIDKLRSVQGVEIAAFLKERPEGDYKASFRAKSYANVARMAFALGGGGHEKASGCIVSPPLSAAIQVIKAAIEEELSE
jgi:bifunctional oligoribonuclease and PAP phosphatase NrnA